MQTKECKWLARGGSLHRDLTHCKHSYLPQSRPEVGGRPAAKYTCTVDRCVYAGLLVHECCTGLNSSTEGFALLHSVDALDPNPAVPFADYSRYRN